MAVAFYGFSEQDSVTVRIPSSSQTESCSSLCCIRLETKIPRNILFSSLEAEIPDTGAMLYLVSLYSLLGAIRVVGHLKRKSSRSKSPTLSTTLPRLADLLPDSMNGRGVIIKPGWGVDHSVLSSKGTVLPEQQNVLFSPSDSGAQRALAALSTGRVFYVWEPLCCTAELKLSHA